MVTPPPALLGPALFACGALGSPVTELLWPMGTGWEPSPLLHQHGQYMDFDSPTLHQGVDMLAPDAEPVYAVQAGVVADLFRDGPYTEIVVQSADGLGFRYVHLDPASLQFELCDTVDVDDYIGDVYGKYEQSPTHPSHLHLERVECVSAVGEVDEGQPREPGGESETCRCAGEWTSVEHPLRRLVGLADDVSPPVILGGSAKEVLFFQDDGDLGGAVPARIPEGELADDKVDVVVRLEDRFLGKRKLTPYRVTLELSQSDTLLQTFHVQFDGPLAPYDAEVLYRSLPGEDHDSEGRYDKRAFYFILTNGASTPGGAPDASGHIDLSLLEGPFTLTVTAWDLGALSSSGLPPLKRSYSFGE